MINQILILTLFSITALVSVFNKKAGYILVAISSAIFLALSIYQYDVTSMFSIIASTVWLLSSIFSIEYDNYGKWLSPLYSTTILGMVIILESTNYLSFLAGWEIMTVPSYVAIGLVRKEFRPAFVFMAFSEFSTALILSSFIIASSMTGTFEFTNLTSPIPLIIATFGFMIKMGIFPFLVTEWLPIAHGTAPSNLSAVLSATMTLMGVFGIFKMATLTLQIPEIFSVILMGIGAFTVFFGALYAYVNENTKGILGFSTIENNGAILVALSLLMITKQLQMTEIENIATVIVLLYAFAHSLAKTGLFLSAGLQEGQSITYAKKMRNVEIGLVLLASSMSGLLPNLGGVATWSLLQNLFMLSYLLHNVVSTILIASGAIIAMGEGFATAMLVRYINYLSLFRNRKEHLSSVKRIPIILAGALVLILGFTLTYAVYPYSNSGAILGMLSKTLILTTYGQSTFGAISPLYVAILITAFSIVAYIAFGKPRIRKTDTWNNGVNDQEEYTAFGMANNIRLMLRKILRVEEEEQKFLPAYGLDVFWEYMYKLAGAIRKFGRIFARGLINSSISWYIIYIVVALIVALIIAVL